MAGFRAQPGGRSARRSPRFRGKLAADGLFWAWFIHFLGDIVIFAFLALALVS